MQRHFTADPGQYVLEAVVMDRNSGKAGAQRTNFEIAVTPRGPALSDVMLVRRTEPLPAEADPAELLRYENGLVVPSLSGRVPRDAKDVSLFFLIHPDSRSSEKPKLEIELRRDGKSIGRTVLQMRPSTEGEPVAYMASIDSASLPGGEYEAAAILTQGGSTAERAVKLTLDGPELASAEPPSGLTPLVADAPKESKLLVITATSTGIPAPAPEELQTLLAGARQRAFDYTNSLPNLICVKLRIVPSIQPARAIGGTKITSPNSCVITIKLSSEPPWK